MHNDSDEPAKSRGLVILEALGLKQGQNLNHWEAVSVRLLDAALSGDPRAVDAVVDSIAPIERHGIRAGIRAWCMPFDRICARLQESEARAS